MPPDGYSTITVPEYLLDRLDRHRDDDGGRPGYAETIETLLDRVESDGGTDALTAEEFESRMREYADDIASTTSKRTADELENRLR
jgi:hypothetical protein